MPLPHHQGVLEYSIALFFAKLVAYTFLFWLPYYIAFNRESYLHIPTYS